jgi:hypothetical protein
MSQSSNTLSITQSAVFTALRSVLGTYGLYAGGTDISIVRGQVNRVPEPKESDYIVMWPLARNRLGTNLGLLADTQFNGQIENNVLSVTNIVTGTIWVGNPIWFLDGTTCVITRQLLGSDGNVGSYCVSTVVDKPPQIIYGGAQQTLQSTDFVVQLDVHGPNSGDNAQRISALWYDQYTVTGFNNLGAAVCPLYADEPKQMPFVNAEEQFEERWVVDLHMQINPIVAAPQQFADQLNANTVLVDTLAVN